MSNPPLHIKGALIWQGAESIEKDLFIQNGRIVSQKPNHALEVDLSGYTLFPGLVNAHDHLELNHFPRTKFREVYDNAHQWGEDVNARLNDEPFKSRRSYPLWDKVFIGGLKNLLCGATTVVHHGPKHKPMYRKDFPVRVLKNYGWAHSLHFSSEEEIVKSYQSTPKNWPWFIHLAEGTDDIAASEYQRLKKLGCIGINTVPVHCVGLTLDDVMESHNITEGHRGHYGHGSQMPFVWCPTTNIYLLGKTGHPRMGWNTQYMLGSDSRLTADGDLLDELRFASKECSADYIFTFVFAVIKTEYRWQDDLKSKVEQLRSEDCADFIALPNSSNVSWDLCHSSRKDLSLVMRDGMPQIGAPELMAKFPNIQTLACTLDGVEKRINVELARQVHRCTLKEQGLELDALPNKRKFIFF
jgi:hypothetical protein